MVNIIMNLSILTSSFKTLVFPLAAAVAKNEGIDFNSIQMTVKEDEGRQTLFLHASQPTFDATVAQTLGVGEEGSAIECEAVADAAGISYAMDNKLLLSMLRNISNANIDVTVTSDGMDIFAADSHFHLDAERRNEDIRILRFTLNATEADNDLTFRLLGTFAPGALPQLLEPSIRMARSAGREACLKSKAVHLLFSEGNKVTVEGMSNVGMTSVGDTDCFTFAQGMDSEVRHYAIPLTAAERLLAMAKTSGREVHIAYDECENRLLAWCNPFCINIVTEDVEACNTPYDMQDTMAVELPVRTVATAISKVKATGNDKVCITITPGGSIEVLAPNGKFSYAFADRILGGVNATQRLLLPLNALLAVMRGFEDEKVTLCFDHDEPYVRIDSKHSEHSAYLLRV